MASIFALRFALLAAGLLAAPIGAAAQPGQGAGAPCALALQAPGNLYYRGARSRGYEVFEPARHQETLQVVIEHRGPACDFVLGVGGAGDSNQPALIGPGGERLEYEIKRSPDGEDLLSANFTPIAPDAVTGSFAAGRSVQTFTFFVEIPPGQTVSPGLYEDAALFRLFRRHQIGETLIEERGVFISADVPAVLEASIGGVPGRTAATVDLGALEPGLTRALDFTLRSNARVEVAFASTHNGRLRHEEVEAYVPYSLTYRGERFTPGALGLTFERPADAAARLETFAGEVGESERAPPAGRYSDRIVVTLTAG